MTKLSHKNCITVVGKNGEEHDHLLSDVATVGDLRASIAKKLNKSYHRVAIYHDEAEMAKNYKLSDDNARLSSDTCKVTSKTRIMWKDLGPQIGYATVFYIEYLGPMVFMALYAICPKLTGGNTALDLAAWKAMNWVAQLGIACWMLHFLKRELETLFVHKFSRPTMPLRNLFKNCAYYWSFGAMIGWPLCSSSYSPPDNYIVVYTGLTLFVLAEIGNLTIHLNLANMGASKPATEKLGSTNIISKPKRSIPMGFGFDYVACPNYTFEILSWVGFSIMTGLLASWAFTVLGFYQMQEWAFKKHSAYKETHGKEYTKLNRKAIVPFVY